MSTVIRAQRTSELGERAGTVRYYPLLRPAKRAPCSNLPLARTRFNELWPTEAATRPVMSRAGAEIMWSQLVQLNAEAGAAGLEFVQLNCDDSIVRLLTITRGSCLVEWPSAKREWYERRHLRLPAGQGAAELTFEVARLAGWFLNGI